MRIRAVLPVNFYFRRKLVRPITPTVDNRDLDFTFDFKLNELTVENHSQDKK